MRPLIIDNEIREQISALVKYAEKNQYSMDDLLDTYNKQMKPAGDMGGYTLVLPFGYRIVYTIENQPAGQVRHFSMSVDADNKLPNEYAVKEIMSIIGFDNPLEKCIVSIEQTGPKRQAINVLEKINP